MVASWVAYTVWRLQHAITCGVARADDERERRQLATRLGSASGMAVLCSVSPDDDTPDCEGAASADPAARVSSGPLGDIAQASARPPCPTPLMSDGEVPGSPALIDRCEAPYAVARACTEQHADEQRHSHIRPEPLPPSRCACHGLRLVHRKASRRCRGPLEHGARRRDRPRRFTHPRVPPGLRRAAAAFGHLWRMLEESWPAPRGCTRAACVALTVLLHGVYEC